MIHDIKQFWSRIEWVTYPQWLGMEITHHHPPAMTESYTFRIHKWTDLCSFFIHNRYIKQTDLAKIMGMVRYLYIQVYRPEMTGSIYYIAPIALFINSGRIFRRVWLAPFGYLYNKGYADIALGTRPSLLWFKYIRFRRVVRPGDKVSS